MTRRFRPVILAVILFLFTVGVACGPTPDRVETLTPFPTAASTPPVGVAFATNPPATGTHASLTPTPLPSATASASPTRFVYTVKAGDTLLAIAIDHGTSVESIMALNPGVQAELLQIGQELVLPPPARPSQQASRVPSPATDLSIVDLSPYPSTLGSLWLLGEVGNDSEQPVEDVRLELSLLDASGDTLMTVTSWALPGIVPARGVAPFGYLFTRPPSEYHDVKAVIVGGRSVSDIGNRYLDLAMSDATVTIGDGRTSLTARISNVGPFPASQVTIVATLYDSAGRVTGFSQIRLEGTLAVGQSRLVELDLAPPGGAIENYTIIAQGLKAEE